MTSLGFPASTLKQRIPTDGPPSPGLSMVHRAGSLGVGVWDAHHSLPTVQGRTTPLKRAHPLARQRHAGSVQRSAFCGQAWQQKWCVSRVNLTPLLMPSFPVAYRYPKPTTTSQTDVGYGDSALHISWGLGDGVLYRNIAWVHIFMCLCRGGVGRKVNLLESEL